MRDKQNSSELPMMKSVNLKRNSECNVLKPRQEFRNFQSKFLVIFSIQANDVKRFKTSNGVR